MEITIIGTGKMARGLATRLLAGGQALTLLGTSSEKARTCARELSGDVHAAGIGDRLQGDVVVVGADHYVMPDLDRHQIEAIRDGRLSMDGLVRERIHAAFVFRFVAVEDYATALGIERAVKAGGLDAGPPHLNPQHRSR